MGTNYSWMRNHCDKCGRHDLVHIGKKSVGWQFSFRGYKPDQWNPDAVVAMSFEDWKKLLSGQTVVSEYGEKETCEEFIEWVTKARGEYVVPATGERRKYLDHITECLGNPREREWQQRRLSDGTDWHDADGFSFSGSEFS